MAQSALTLALALGRRVGDEGQSSIDSAMPSIVDYKVAEYKYEWLNPPSL
jgi:hypothetical protein